MDPSRRKLKKGTTRYIRYSRDRKFTFTKIATSLQKLFSKTAKPPFNFTQTKTSFDSSKNLTSSKKSDRFNPKQFVQNVSWISSPNRRIFRSGESDLKIIKRSSVEKYRATGTAYRIIHTFAVNTERGRTTFDEIGLKVLYHLRTRPMAPVPLLPLPDPSGAVLRWPFRTPRPSNRSQRGDTAHWTTLLAGNTG